MKKKLLLVIPALMVLSACQPLSAEAGTKLNLFAEDTLAHDDIFGQAEGGLRKTLPFNANGANAANPVIAVQYMDESEGYRSLRFVAAVKIKDGDLANTEAVWTRTMYQDDGSVQKAEHEFESTKAYTTVNDGGYALDINDFPGYTHFVVYAMRNIPKATANDYFLNVSLSLNNLSDDSYDAESNICATTVNLNKQLSFPKNQSGYFLQGRINGADNAVVASAGAPDGSVARFSSNFASGDSFYVCHKSADEFMVYDSTYRRDNPYFVDDGQASKRIALSNTAPAGPFAFNIKSADHKLNDIDIGFTVSYTNNSEQLIEDVPMIYDGQDISEKNQFVANIAPKSGSELSFKYRGAAVSNPYGEDGSNASGSSPVTIPYGGPSINVFLKDAISSHPIWAAFPEETYTLLINGVAQAATDVNPGGWGVKALYEVHLTAGQVASVQWGYTTISAAAVAKESDYWIRFNDDRSVQCVDRVSDYCLVGTINGNNEWDSTSHHFINTTVSGEYKLASFELSANDAVKVKNVSNGTWYPDGSGNDYIVGADGTYDIYFRPAGGHDGWHHGYFYLAALD